jgi:ligand-binding sensor domain-containing protein/serine phosphatase RsbU (regulator of sigma subunit)
VLLLSLIAPFKYPTVHAQNNQNIFDKIEIEIEGEKIYDVYAITQDPQGYMWMRTNLGLVRYDGIEGKIYTSESLSTSPQTYYNFYVDSQDDFWIGHSSGMTKYNPDCDCLQDYPARHANSPISNISSITEDKNKNIWIGTWDGELYQQDKERNSFTRFLHSDADTTTLNFSLIKHLLVDSNNNLWIGTNSGLVVYNIDARIINQFSHNPKDKNSLLDNRISALHEDNKGQILIGTYKSGFHIYNSRTESMERISHDVNDARSLYAPYAEDNVFGRNPYVRLIHQDQNGNYWISTTGKGINHFNSGTANNVNFNFGLVNPQILWSLFEDRQGNLWIGGIGGSGLYRTDLYGRRYTLYSNFSNVEAAYESPLSPGTIWIKSRQGGLSKMDLKTQEITHYLHERENAKSIGHNWVRSSYQETSNILWVGLGGGGVNGVGSGDGGIDRMDIENETFTHFSLTRPDDGLDGFSYTVYTICQDDEGILWLGCGTGGIFRSDKSRKKFTAFDSIETEDSQSDQIFNIVRIDSNGDLWASDGSGQGTLYLYNRQKGKFLPFLKGFQVTNVAVDKNGWLILSTWEKGLLHLNPSDRSYIQYTKKDGLPSNVALDLVADTGDIFWVNTRMGPAKFYPGSNEIIPVGLPKTRYNFGIFKALNGPILLGVNNGLISFKAEEVEGNPFPPQVNLSSVLVSDMNYLTLEKLSNDLILSYDQNDIEINYVGLHFSKPEKNLYQYKLNPLDGNWIDVGVKRSVRFANLSPGSYNFQVKASNSDGIWSEPLNYTFTINPPWWNTLWAKAAYVISALLLITGMMRWRTINLMQRQKELETIVANATLEIRTQKEEVESQKEEIEVQRDMVTRQKDQILEQNQAITNSIEYASRIQSAVLPPDEVFKYLLPKHFILYKPRDIVSGDFYWLTHHKGEIIIAVADSTGHGVPGAFMSMLGITLLRETVNKTDQPKANLILNELRDQVILSLRQTGKVEEAKDGMDISLCILNKETMSLQYAGANNRLYLIREGELIEIIGDGMPIGISSKAAKSFTNHEMKVHKDDSLYMFSDGYADQFGGEKRKKFMSKRLKQLLIEIQDNIMLEQKEILEQTINNWMGKTGSHPEVVQIDDMIVMGIKL